MEKKKEKILYDKEKPSLDDIEVKADMEMVYNVELLADVIVEGGIEIIFGLTGGHQWPFEGPVMKRGIPRVHVHHECTAPFAGDAWGRIKGKPAAVSLTAGPGMMNAVSGVMQAKQAQSPMFLFCGAHPTTDDDRFPIQEGYAEYSLGPCTKYVRRVVSPYTSVFQTKRALRACQTPPMGPVALEFPLDTVSIVGKIPKSVALTGYARGFFPPRDLRRFMADPALVEEAVKWILGAEKPTIIVGEGVHYDDAASELNEFVKLLGIPCHSRRVGRGAFSEYDYLNCYGRARGKVMRASDRCLVIGLRVAYLENFGYPPFWGHDTRYIQINHCVENMCLALPTVNEIIGNHKMVLRQMIDCVKSLGVTEPPKKWDEWRKFVREAREAVEKRVHERTEKMKSDIPIHPDILGRYVAEVCDEELSGDVIAILDAFTGSSFFTDWFKAKFPAQVLDSSEMMGIGHGIGMSIGAGLATERRYPIIAFMGDTGFLAYMGDVETALRWEIPVVYIVNNNSGTAIAGWKPFYSKQMSPTGRWEWDSFGFTKDMPFHSMFAPLPGMHTELVERPDEIKPALKRALKHVREKSKPAVVNVIVDAEVLMDGWAAWFCVCHTHQPWEDIPDEGKRWFLSGLGLGPNGLELYYPEVAAKKDEWMKKLGMK